jgi:hypothetical protein
MPVRQRGVGSLGAADGVAEDAEGASFAEPVPGLAVDGERLAGVLDRPVGRRQASWISARAEPACPSRIR